MAIMYLKKNFTFPKEQISLYMYLSVPLLFRNMKPYVNSLVNSVDQDQLTSEEAS